MLDPNMFIPPQVGAMQPSTQDPMAFISTPPPLRLPPQPTPSKITTPPAPQNTLATTPMNPSVPATTDPMQQTHPSDHLNYDDVHNYLKGPIAPQQHFEQWFSSPENKQRFTEFKNAAEAMKASALYRGAFPELMRDDTYRAMAMASHGQIRDIVEQAATKLGGDDPIMKNYNWMNITMAMHRVKVDNDMRQAGLKPGFSVDEDKKMLGNFFGDPSTPGRATAMALNLYNGMYKGSDGSILQSATQMKDVGTQAETQRRGQDIQKEYQQGLLSNQSRQLDLTQNEQKVQARLADARIQEIESTLGINKAHMKVEQDKLTMFGQQMYANQRVQWYNEAMKGYTQEQQGSILYLKSIDDAIAKNTEERKAIQQSLASGMLDEKKMVENNATLTQLNTRIEQLMGDQRTAVERAGVLVNRPLTDVVSESASNLLRQYTMQSGGHLPTSKAEVMSHTNNDPAQADIMMRAMYSPVLHDVKGQVVKYPTSQTLDPRVANYIADNGVFQTVWYPAMRQNGGQFISPEEFNTFWQRQVAVNPTFAKVNPLQQYRYTKALMEQWYKNSSRSYTTPSTGKINPNYVVPAGMSSTQPEPAPVSAGSNEE